VRAREFTNEDTVSGNIAIVAQPLNTILKRSPIYLDHAKYKNSVTKPKKYRTNHAF